MYKVGRVLQAIGLILLPVAMAGNMARPEEFGLWYTLGLSSVGIVVFTLGWLLQQASGRQ
jgi:hypothetical protein